MNKFIEAIKKSDFNTVETLLHKNPKLIEWREDSGKNALHYLCGQPVSGNKKNVEAGLKILKLLLKKGMDINSVHRIEDNCDIFPATPLWYAYTRGRNEKLYYWLLKQGADPENCMYAIAWYNDVKASTLFQKHGASIDRITAGTSPFLSAFCWKRFNIAEWFLRNGADVNSPDPDGNTALLHAIKRKLKPEQIELLMKYRADVNRENKDGVSPKKLAGQNRQKKILGIFERYPDK